MIKYIKYYILLGVAILAASCEDKFDAKIYGSLMENEFPTNAKEYESYMMTCYLPFTTAFTYSINEGTGQHGWYIATGGDIRFFDSTTDIMAPGYTRCNGGWLYLSKADYENCIYYWRGWVNDENSPNHFMKTAEITRFTEIIGTLEKHRSMFCRPIKRTVCLERLVFAAE